MCDKAQEVVEAWERGEAQPDVLVNVPPGSSKSTVWTQILPAWIWTRNPHARIISSSYSNDLSTIHAVKSRDILKSDKYNIFYPGHIDFKKDTDGKTHYKNTKKGERFVTSTGGTVTGMHADFIIADDPVKPKGAGRAEMDEAVTFMKETLSSRKTDKERTVTILIMQRLHDLDPAGVWLKEKPLNRLCLPAEQSELVYPESLNEYYVEGLLDIKRLGHVAVANAKRDLGSYGYAGQYAQSPVPAGGGIWKAGYIRAIPDDRFPKVHELTAYGTDWDTAYTDKQKNDASGYVTSGRMGSTMYIDKLGFERKEMPELIALMKSLPTPAYIEAKASGKSAKQMLTSMGVTAIEVEVQGGDKEARANLATPRAEAGLVYCRQSLMETLLYDAEQGILRFPNGAHDDLQDALVQAIQRHNGPTFIIGAA